MRQHSCSLLDGLMPSSNIVVEFFRSLCHICHIIVQPELSERVHGVFVRIFIIHVRVASAVDLTKLVGEIWELKDCDEHANLTRKFILIVATCQIVLLVGYELRKERLHNPLILLVQLAAHILIFNLELPQLIFVVQNSLIMFLHQHLVGLFELGVHYHDFCRAQSSFHVLDVPFDDSNLFLQLLVNLKQIFIISFDSFDFPIIHNFFSLHLCHGRVLYASIFSSFTASIAVKR